MQKLLIRAYGLCFNIGVRINKRTTAIKAFKLFCRVRKGKVLPRQRSFLNHAKYKLFTLAGHQLQLYRWNGGPETVLLLHGWESNTYRWRNLVAKLSEKNFTILAFDAPGHGHSEGKELHVPLYAQVTRHVLDTYRPDYVVAHSLGGMTIHYTHYLNPLSSVKKIVTVGAPCEFEQFVDHYQDLLKFNHRVREAMNQRLKEWFGLYFHEFSCTVFAKKNTIKGLLLHDEDDLQVPVEASKKVQQHWKNSELVITKGLGHSMHQDSVNKKIIAFLQH